jgi:hypothetical protein
MKMIKIQDYPRLLEWFDRTIDETISGKITPLTWAHKNLSCEVPLKEPDEKLCYILVEMFDTSGPTSAAVEGLRLYWPTPQPNKIYKDALLDIPIELLVHMIQKSESLR